MVYIDISENPRSSRSWNICFGRSELQMVIHEKQGHAKVVFYECNFHIDFQYLFILASFLYTSIIYTVYITEPRRTLESTD